MLQSGIYKNDERLIAVNPPAEEFGMSFYNANDLKPLLDGMNLTVVNVESNPSGASEDDNELQSELWKLFLISMIIFLALESYFTLPPSQARNTNEGASA